MPKEKGRGEGERDLLHGCPAHSTSSPKLPCKAFVCLLPSPLLTHMLWTLFFPPLYSEVLQKIGQLRGYAFVLLECGLIQTSSKTKSCVVSVLIKRMRQRPDMRAPDDSSTLFSFYNDGFPSRRDLKQVNMCLKFTALARVGGNSVLEWFTHNVPMGYWNHVMWRFRVHELCDIWGQCLWFSKRFCYFTMVLESKPCCRYYKIMELEGIASVLWALDHLCYFVCFFCSDLNFLAHHVSAIVSYERKELSGYQNSNN